MRTHVWVSVLAVVFTSFAPSAQVAWGEDAPVPTTALVPGDALAVVHVPDCAAIKKAFADSEFGKLAVEPEFQLFARPAIDELLKVYADYRKAMPLLPDPADLGKTMGGDLTIAISAPLKPGEPPGVTAAVRIADAQAAGRLLQMILAGKGLPEGQPVPLMLDGPTLLYEKGLLLFAIDAAALDKMRGRLNDPAKRAGALEATKEWAAAKKLAGPDGLFSVYANVPALLALALTEAPDAAREKTAITQIGLDNVKTIVLQGVRRGDRLGMDIAIGIDGAPAGFVAALLDAKPVPASALSVVPEKATFCSASQFDPAALLKFTQAMMDPEQAANLGSEITRLNEELKIDLSKDLFESLGSTWTMYDVGGTEFFGIVPGMALTVEVKDAAKVKKAIDGLLKMAEGAMADVNRFMPVMEFREVELGDVHVRYLSFTTMPISPAVAIAKGHLFVTLSVGSLRRALAQLNLPGNITTTPQFKETIERLTGKPLDLNALPAQFSYSCPDLAKTSLTPAANMAQLFINIFNMQRRFMRGNGMGGLGFGGEDEQLWNVLGKVDFALFPSDEVIVKYMKPSGSALIKTGEGVVFRSDIALPSSGALASGQSTGFMIGLVAAVAVPSGMRSRTAANETAAAAACKAFAEAEEIYHRTDYTGNGVLKYAQSIHGNRAVKVVEPTALPDPTDADTKTFTALKQKLSSEDFAEREGASVALEKAGPGIIKLLQNEAKETKDTEVKARCEAVAAKLKRSLIKSPQVDTQHGLLSSGSERGREGDLSLVDKTFAEAEGQPSEHRKPKAGYCFKVLTAQGPHATGGRRNYLVPPDGDPMARNMTLGYALIAYPSKYDSTGRDCFMINNNGTIFQKDMGKDTAKLVEEMTEFDPDETWVPTQ